MNEREPSWKAAAFTTSDGRPARILCTDLKRGRPMPGCEYEMIVYAVPDGNGNEQIYQCDQTGRKWPRTGDDPDLVLRVRVHAEYQD